MGHGKARARCRQQTADKVTDAEHEKKEWRAAHVGGSVSEMDGDDKERTLLVHVHE